MKRAVGRNELYWKTLIGTDIAFIKYLIDTGTYSHKELCESLINISFNGNSEIAKILIDKGADACYNNMLALKFASQKGYSNVVRILVTSLNTISKQDPKSCFDKYSYNFSIELAAMNNHHEVMDVLFSSVSDVISLSTRSKRALGDYSLKHKNVAMIRVLHSHQTEYGNFFSDPGMISEILFYEDIYKMLSREFIKNIPIEIVWDIFSYLDPLLREKF